MANPMDYSQGYSIGRHDESQVPCDEDLSRIPHDPSLIAFANNHAFNHMPQDGGLLQSFDRPGPQGDLEGRLGDVMLTYDTNPGVGVSLPMNLDTGSAFAFDVSTTYPATFTGFTPSLNHSQSRTFPPFLQSLPPSDQWIYQQSVPQIPADTYNTATNSTGSYEHSDFSRASSRSQVPVQRPIQEQHYPRYGQPASYRAPQPVAIQPKKPAIKGAQFPGLSTPEAGSTEHTGIYSNSGFDVLGVLSRVAMRPNAKINIGAVDLSCAFVLCDIRREDQPIVYISDAFERLTGYTKDEIIGKNCRFLQDPDGRVSPGSKRVFVDGQTVYRLRSTIEDRSEIQASIINYRKGGQPFMNLVTMIPIRWNSEDYRFYVGFQVDLVEKPDAVTRRNPDGTYSINYQRGQLPQYVVPPPDIYRLRPDLATWFTHDEVTAVLHAAGVPGSGVSRQYLDRILVENTDDVIHVLSFNGEFLYLSPSSRKVLEYDPVELVGKTLSTICHPSDIGPVIRDIRARTSPTPLSVVYRIRQKYKGYMWFESHGAWHIDPNQGRQYLVMTGHPRPVYSLNQVARAGSFAALAENDVWAKLSLSGVILFISSKAKPVLGRTPDDLIGKGIQELIEPDDDPNAIEDALDAASKEQSEKDKPDDPPSFRHQIRHRKGHTLSAHTTLYAGDEQNGNRPSFLVAQIRFARAFPPSSVAIPATAGNITNITGTAKRTTVTTSDPNPPRQYGALGQEGSYLSTLVGLNGLPTGNRSLSPDAPTTLFTELNPTRGSNWQIELRELEKQNRTLADELQRLLSRHKKRKRKQSAISVEKVCTMCGTRNTPEWRRGPSGNRDLCNSCGLRWAKQNRSQMKSAAVLQ